jgi:hypothetical protein
LQAPGQAQGLLLPVRVQSLRAVASCCNLPG